MERILLVEDDKALNWGIKMALKKEETEIISCFNLKDAKEAFHIGEIDLVLLDINLPDGNGLEFLKEIKREKEVAVILLTANDTEIDMVTGLETGADDYITKPFSLAVLRARVGVQLRRKKGSVSHQILIDSFSFDFDKMEFKKGEQKIELSKTEQKLLWLLVKNQGITLRRAELIDKIWTDGAAYVDENALSVTVKRVRDKLGAGEYIKTVYGLGYVWKKE